MTTSFIVRQLQNEFPLNSVVPINLTRKLLNLFPLWTSSNQCRQTWERFEWDRLNFEEPLSMPKVYPTFSICRMSAISHSFSSRSFSLSLLFFSIFLSLSLSVRIQISFYQRKSVCPSLYLHTHSHVCTHTHTRTFARALSLSVSFPNVCLTACVILSVYIYVYNSFCIEIL